MWRGLYGRAVGKKTETFLPLACLGKKRHPRLARVLSESSKQSLLQLHSYSITGNFSFLLFFIFLTITGRTQSNRAKATVMDIKADFKMTVHHTDSSFPLKNRRKNKAEMLGWLYLTAKAERTRASTMRTLG